MSKAGEKVRAYIPKRDGRQWTLGVAVLEDKIVQRTTVEALNAIYETDIVGFSYGYHPGRSKHDVLNALFAGIRRERLVVGFQYRKDAERFLVEPEKRFSQFNLQIHKDRTRLIEFGRFAAQSRKRPGKGKPETFDFLAFMRLPFYVAKAGM